MDLLPMLFFGRIIMPVAPANVLRWVKVGAFHNRLGCVDHAILAGGN